ncbi:uncharacterized protein MELLADRAFT_124365 [Melampsora larici-populina 98AG31]|uniref:Secreted protein n=1 Tax=Melampsora larici-populina (strain 98AG31 / pathotype 3-4-7) TaxID=747676 RepID=F4SE09_MELLP|nr:uncharacterized protein MELLADRAFT_124365 [Melampsora larici-populina 98AG31]EGF97117.1 secreted protein [Melampsora larici-populina 98AG31]
MDTVFLIASIVLICTSSAIVQPVPIQTCGGYELTKPLRIGSDNQVIRNGDKGSSFRQHLAHEGDGYSSDADHYDTPVCPGCCRIPCCSIM